MLASPKAMARAAAISSPSASSAVAASLLPPPDVLHTTIPRAVQAAVSSEALRAPVIPSMSSFGRRLISDPGSGVRSRIDSTMSKSASWFAASSSFSNALAKNTTSARACNGDQSALVFATPCQSSSTATLVMFLFLLFFANDKDSKVHRRAAEARRNRPCASREAHYFISVPLRRCGETSLLLPRSDHTRLPQRHYLVTTQSKPIAVYLRIMLSHRRARHSRHLVSAMQPQRRCRHH